MQLIVFFDLFKFPDLMETMNNEVLTEVYYTVVKDPISGSQRKIPFNEYDNTLTVHILYIDKNGYPESAPFDQDKASQSPIILIPDDSRINYRPTEQFMIMRHNEPVFIYKILIENNDLYLRTIHSKEEPDHGSMYYKLLKFIGNDENINFTDFLNKNIPEWNPKLIAVLDFLHNCREQESIINADHLIEYNLKIDFLENLKFDDLAIVRDKLLQQCSFDTKID